MKLLRVGELGSEIVAALDGNNVIRDLSDHIKDLNPQTINEETLNKLKRIKTAVTLGNKLGLEVHAGHGLTYKSAKILSKISGIKEFNIGHFLIGESIFVGLNKTIKNFRKIVK